jgi:hypothetical protein
MKIFFSAISNLPRIAIAISSIWLTSVTSVSALTLYDGASGKTPDNTQQPIRWTYLVTTFPVYLPIPSATATTSGTTLDTGASSNYGGYFLTKANLSSLLLNRINGYSISLKVQINSESHADSNRAGFSLLAMSNLATGDMLPYGIELGFWKDRIWAQNVGFTKGESVAYTTTTSRVYRLAVLNKTYKLYDDSVSTSTPILTGNLRNYTGFICPGTNVAWTPTNPQCQNPYATPNLIFMGDDTSKATAKVLITKVNASF